MKNLSLFATLLLSFFVSKIQCTDVQEDCGRPIGSYSTGKIVGGYDIGYYKYPWYVSLKKDGETFCGGTLIAKRFVVTAAHCFQPFFKAVEAGHTTFEKIFTPTFGIYNVCASEPTQKVFKVAKVYIHEKYKKMDPYYDIALIRLKREAKGFRPCCLPRKALSSRTRPREALVSGLGDQRFNAKVATCTMHEARILIYDDDVCRDMLDSQGEEGKRLEHAFCAGYLQGGIDACQGDSGGPLIISRSNGRFDLLGITSFGFECAKPNTLGIYTDVTHYLDWLHERMNASPSKPSPSTVSPNPQPVTEDPSTNGQASSVNWSIYPVTPWDSSTFLTPPLETMPPEEPPQHAHHKPQSVIIIINLKKKHKSDKRKHKKLLRKHRS